MKKAITRMFTSLGAMVALALVLGFTVRFMRAGHVDAHTVLEIDFDQPLVEYVPDDPVAGVLQGRMAQVHDVLEALERGATDDRVVALVARVGAAPMGLARIQELRDAVIAFRASGKPAIAYSLSFGEFSAGNGSYYLATAFDEIYLQPSGDVGLTGLIVESPFLRGALDKLGVVPRMDHRREYKNAMNIFTEKGFTPAHREAATRVMDSQFGQIVRGIAAARAISEDRLRALIDGGPLSAEQALEAKLLDGLAYRDEAWTKLEEKLGEEPVRLSALRYLQRVRPRHGDGEKIALIYGVGGVRRGDSALDPVTGEQSMGADSVTAALRAAIDDDDVRAILFRVDSPGGSYVASDTIWREVVRARAAGKPVVVSMADVAGSGGYFVAIPADKIVAQPGTITGSIGVLGGKMVTEAMWEKIGVNWEEVHTSTNGTMWTTSTDYTPAEWERFQASLDRIYRDFTTKVSEGRKLPMDKVLEIARGRIWTGEDALGIGLVDALGGFPTALALAKEAAGIPAGDPVHLETFPPAKSLLQTVAARFVGTPDSEEYDAPVTIALRRMMDVTGPLANVARQVGLLAQPGVLTMGFETGQP
ncbi:MAG TPA: signal peptide peptidase SppA [Candidatus Binatia bacterium]|jgi:protease-4|nr:signal peptide peptidase SppA [Candidatus Binatia bacterium]